MMKIYKLEYYSALKNEVTKFVGKWIDYEYISYNLRKKKLPVLLHMRNPTHNICT